MIDFEPVTLLMSLALFGAFSVPFIYHSQKNRKKEASLKSHLFEVAKKLEAMPDQTEIWRNQYALGIDTSKGVLSYHREVPISYSMAIDLKDYKKVSLIRRNSDMKNGTVNNTVLDYLALELFPKSGTSSIQLEIFDGEQFSDLLGETVLAERWAEIIQSHLN
jgi:hypothetical protein